MLIRMPRLMLKYSKYLVLLLQELNTFHYYFFTPQNIKIYCLIPLKNIFFIRILLSITQLSNIGSDTDHILSLPYLYPHLTFGYRYRYYRMRISTDNLYLYPMTPLVVVYLVISFLFERVFGVRNSNPCPLVL